MLQTSLAMKVHYFIFEYKDCSQLKNEVKKMNREMLIPQDHEK
jgi:hypothetical protein